MTGNLMTGSLFTSERLQINRDLLFEQVWKNGRRVEAVAIDIETDTRYVPGTSRGPERDFGLSYGAPVTTVAFAWRDPGASGGVPCDQTGIHTAVVTAPASGDWAQDDPEFCRFLAGLYSSNTWVVAHNAVFDVRGLGKLTDRLTDTPYPGSLWDTMVMERLLVCSKDARYDLLSVAKAHRIPVPDWMRDMKKSRGALHDLPVEKVAEYAGMDARVALLIFENQASKFPANQQTKDGLVDWECRAMREYSRMASEGVTLDLQTAQDRLIVLAQTRTELEAKLKADGLSKPGSPAQRVTYMYDKKGIPRPTYEPGSIFFTDGGALSASTDVIEALAEDYPELHLLASWLSVDRMQGMIASLVEHAALDGRVHALTTIQTETGRRASGHPNLQNLKMSSEDTDLSGDMAGLLRGRDGFTLVEVDYSNAENWIAAMLSGDDALARACSAQDFHSAMAEQYFGEEWALADPKHRKHLRKQGKSITFGSAYGMGGRALARKLKITEQQAYALLEAKDRAFPYIAEAKQLASEKGKKQGHVTLWTGRSVPVDPNRAYTAWNYLCQGGVGEMVKRSIVLISETYRANNLRSRVALDMHDAVILEVAHDEWEQATRIASEIMQGIIPEHMNQRTDPPIRWIAEADPLDNQKKWGKGQLHPVVEVVPVPVPPTPAKTTTKKQVTIVYPDIDFSGVVVLDETGCTSESRDTYYQAMQARCKALLDGPYCVPVPGRPGEVKVNLENYIKVLKLWHANAHQLSLTPLDTPAYNMTADVLEEEIQVHEGFFSAATRHMARISNMKQERGK